MRASISYYYVSAPAGSGKTYSAIRHAVDKARLGEKVIIAQPSKMCIAEWHPKAQEYADGFKCQRRSKSTSLAGVNMHHLV